MQEEKQKILEEKNVHLWFYGSPVVLCSMHLDLDTETGKLYTAAKFLNVQPEHIKEMSIEIICYDVIRNVIDTISEYTYTGFDVARNEDFGLSLEIPVPNTDTRNVEFILKSVTTINDETWYNTDNLKFNISLEQNNIFSAQGDLNKHFQELCLRSNIDSTQLIFQPIFDNYHWMCGCGCLNWNDEDICSQCGISKEWLYCNASEEALKKQERLFKIAEEQAKAEALKQLQYEKEIQKEEFQQRQKQYQKQVRNQKSRKVTKKLLIVLLVLLLICALALGVIQFLIPYLEYSQAKNALDQKMYDSAIEQFTSIGNFLDSEELLNKAQYEKATDMYNSGNKEDAAIIYKNISGYMDSEQKYYDIEYEIANNYYSENSYAEAAEIYKQIPEYMDCQKRLDAAYENIYNNALELLEQGNLNDAYYTFLYLEDYSDSKNMLNECTYRQAEKYYKKMEYKNALDTYNQIADYKDVPEILNNLKSLSNIISASTDISSPAIWNCSNVRCNVCNSQTSATYSLAFGINGTYTFEVSCENHDYKIDKTGYYKIEDNTVYILEYKNGQTIWSEFLTITSIEKLANEEDGKNAVLVITNPFNTKQTITVYGNIISSDNIAF